MYHTHSLSIQLNYNVDADGGDDDDEWPKNGFGQIFSVLENNWKLVLLNFKIHCPWLIFSSNFFLDLFLSLSFRRICVFVCCFLAFYPLSYSSVVIILFRAVAKAASNSVIKFYIYFLPSSSSSSTAAPHSSCISKQWIEWVRVREMKCYYCVRLICCGWYFIIRILPLLLPGLWRKEE